MYTLSKKTKGDIAELIIAAKLLEDGWKISFPYGEDHRYDLIAEKDKKFVRIQAKYVTPKNGVLDVNCRSSNNWSVMTYTPEEIDFIAVYDSVNKNIYFISVQDINRKSFKIRIEDCKNKQIKKVHPAENFSELKI